MTSPFRGAALPASPWAARRAGDDYGAPASPDWRDVDWSPYVRSLTIDGRRVNYCDYGSAVEGARPVMLVHGLAACWQSWLEQIPRLAAEGPPQEEVGLTPYAFGGQR